MLLILTKKPDFAISNKVVSVRILQRAIHDPSRVGRFFPALLTPLRMALIWGFSQ